MTCEALGSWPGYDTANRPTMIFDAQSGVEQAPFEEERALWESLL